MSSSASQSSPENVDPLDIWKEEISPELRKWLEEQDFEDAVAKTLCNLERRSPDDFFTDHTDTHAGVRKMWEIVGRNIRYVDAMFRFYRTFHGPTFEKERPLLMVMEQEERERQRKQKWKELRERERKEKEHNQSNENTNSQETNVTSCQINDERYGKDTMQFMQISRCIGT